MSGSTGSGEAREKAVGAVIIRVISRAELMVFNV